jgi:hypothetical protein
MHCWHSGVGTFSLECLLVRSSKTMSWLFPERSKGGRVKGCLAPAKDSSMRTKMRANTCPIWEKGSGFPKSWLRSGGHLQERQKPPEVGAGFRCPESFSIPPTRASRPVVWRRQKTNSGRDYYILLLAAPFFPKPALSSLSTAFSRLLLLSASRLVQTSLLLSL